MKSWFKGRSAFGFIPSIVDILYYCAVLFDILWSVFLQEWKELHPFDTIIIDIAAQGDETETTTYLSKFLWSKSRTRFVKTVVVFGDSLQKSLFAKNSFKQWLKHLQRRVHCVERCMATRSSTGTTQPYSEAVFARRYFYPDSFFFLHEQVKIMDQIRSVVSDLFFGLNVKNRQRPRNTI